MSPPSGLGGVRVHDDSIGRAPIPGARFSLLSSCLSVFIFELWCDSKGGRVGGGNLVSPKLEDCFRVCCGIGQYAEGAQGLLMIGPRKGSYIANPLVGGQLSELCVAICENNRIQLYAELGFYFQTVFQAITRGSVERKNAAQLAQMTTNLPVCSCEESDAADGSRARPARGSAPLRPWPLA